jgi:hypothetical protein
MANALYRKLPSGDWMNQANPGGPSYFRVSFNLSDSLWYVQFTYDGLTWFQHANPQPTAAQMQAALDTYVGNLNAGTA